MKSVIQTKNVRGKSTAVRVLSQKPLRIIPTSSQSEEVRLILSSYGGGMVQGDYVALGVTCGENAHLYLGSQANNHIYKSDKQTPSEQILMGEVRANACAVINPEPSVLHEQSLFTQSQVWNIKENGNLILVDWLHSGRSESGERYEFTQYKTTVEIQRDSRPVFIEKFQITPEEGLLDARFGPYNLMMTIYCAGQATAAIVQELELYTNKELMRLNELKTTAATDFPDCYYASFYDAGADITVFRALSKKRRDLEPIFSMIENVFKQDLFKH